MRGYWSDDDWGHFAQHNNEKQLGLTFQVGVHVALSIIPIDFVTGHEFEDRLIVIIGLQKSMKEWFRSS